MSKLEILAELPKLKPEERHEIRLRLAELEHEEWLDDGEFSEDQKRLINQRLEEYDRDPGTGSSWEDVKKRLEDKLRGE